MILVLFRDSKSITMSLCFIQGKFSSLGISKSVSCESPHQSEIYPFDLGNSLHNKGKPDFFMLRSYCLHLWHNMTPHKCCL